MDPHSCFSCHTAPNKGGCSALVVLSKRLNNCRERHFQRRLVFCGTWDHLINHNGCLQLHSFYNSSSWEDFQYWRGSPFTSTLYWFCLNIYTFLLGLNHWSSLLHPPYEPSTHSSYVCRPRSSSCSLHTHLGIFQIAVSLQTLNANI